MERWYWIELIGFDNEAEDMGVDAFLSRNVSTAGVSLLFSHIDFIFEQESELLPDNACSYGGHEYNRERRRQNWTRTQLKKLVDTLHRRGVKVFFSTFDLTDRITDPDMLSFNDAGAPRRLICVLKKGVGDEVIRRIGYVLDHYGFDGLQLADGLSSSRQSIENGDFSLELCERSGIDIPERLNTEGREAYIARRKWILKNASFEWRRYMTDLWAEFYEKLFAAVNKPIMFNNTWTRDSFEAYYRYGLDYRRCQLDSAMAVMIEENSATRAITAPEDEGGVVFPMSHRDTFTYEYSLMQQDIKLMTGGKKQISLMPISDTLEQWDALRHCPTELVRSTVKRYNNFVYREGDYEVCCNAPLYCLSDGIAAEDWLWLAKQESYRIPTPDSVDGFVAVRNLSTLERDVWQFCRRKCYYGSALLCELVNNGLNLSASLELKDVPSFDRARALVLTDLNVYTESEKTVLTETKLPLLVIGEEVELPMEKKGFYSGKYLSVALYGDWPDVELDFLGELERIIAAGVPVKGEKWTEPLEYRRVGATFFKELCGRLNEILELDRCASTDVKVNSYICGGEKYIILSNDRHTYYLPEIKTASPTSEVTALMKERGYKVKMGDGSFTVRIPPRCVEIVKIKL